MQMKTWWEYQNARVSGVEKNVPWWVNDKLKLHKFLVDNNIPTPNLYEVWKQPEEIELNSLPTEFVLKPSVMHSAAGVCVFRKVAENKFHDQLRQRTMSIEGIIKEQKEIYNKCKFKSAYRIFAEEKIYDSQLPKEKIPLDYKVFCFYGIPKMVFQFDRNVTPKAAAWFDGGFDELDMNNIQSDWKFISKGVAILPIHHMEMLSIAARVSSLLKTPFISVDMYESTRGPVVGELTPAPGGPYYKKMYEFSQNYDIELGKAWERAEQRISAELS